MLLHHLELRVANAVAEDDYVPRPSLILLPELDQTLDERDPQRVYQFKTEITAGMSSINNSTTGAVAHLPFGGNGKSGNGDGWDA